MSGKAAKLTADNTLPEITSQPNANGGRLRVGGKKGNKGGHGAVPKAFKDFIRDEMRNGFKSRHALIEASRDPESKGFNIAWKLAADYDDDKPAEKHAIAGKVEVTVRIQREGRRLTNS
jgi:hypothetical protein